VHVLVDVTVVVWEPTRCEQADDIVGAAQFPRAAGVVSWLDGVAGGAKRLSIDRLGPLLGVKKM
jgi:hypothetical protein